MKKLLQLTQPVYLLWAILACFLGAGIARYLGHLPHWPTFWLGLLACLSLLVALFWLTHYFRLPLTPLDPEETPRQRELLRTRLLQFSYAALTLAGAATLALLLTHLLTLSAGLLLLLAAFLVVLYAVPPFRLYASGYGELLLAVLVSTLFPAFAFLLQAETLHRLLPMITFPLTVHVIASLLAADFSAFATDQKLGRQSLLIRLTWPRAVTVHHLLLLIAFLLFSAAPLFGVSWGLIGPVFFALPFAALEIAWLQRIAAGGRPVWKFFNALVFSAFPLTLYLLTLSFWLR
jgi:1,4-dihydroxy-2-naphthoate octaprenyltransferase